MPQLAADFDKSHKNISASSSGQSRPVHFPYPSTSFFHFRRPSVAGTNMTSAAHSPRTGPSQSTMAFNQQMYKDGKKVNISSLMSPPDQVLDSFNHGNNNAQKTTPSTGKPAMQPLPMSPPVSPYHKAISHTPTTPPSHAINDPVLYPADEGSVSSPPQAPLFAPTELEDHRRLVEEHLRSRPAGIFGGVAPPRREDYELALTFRTQVMKHFNANPKGWVRKERALLEADRRASTSRYPTLMPAKPLAAKPTRVHRADRISKPVSHNFNGTNGPRPIRSNGAGIGAGAVPNKRPAPRASPTPEPSRRAVAPNREDKDFGSLPDYCPPTDTLNGRPNSLKVEWKGQPIDLSHDMHRHLLHPDEVHLAGALRLDCATYLTSKRRIFERRLRCLISGKEFRKTDAQQACKIDVNKASKLWMAFDKAGWLQPRWMQNFV